MSIKKGTIPPRYDEAFKAGAVKMVTEQGRPSKEVAAELGICIDTLKSWLKRAGFQPGATDRQNRNDKRQRELEAEIRSLRKQHEQKLLRILISFHEKHPAAGLDALVHMIKPMCPCSRNTLHRLMKLHNIHSIRKKAYKITTNSKHSYAVSPNLLQRNFIADKPNQKWVGDITYIRTDEGWLYAAIVKDLCLKKIVGYAFSDHIDTNLTVTALEMAVNRQKPQEDLIFHSDRGVQYASSQYREALAKHNITQSMSRKGDPYDNAVAENFFSCLKCELVHHKHYRTRAEAQADIFSYIETYYNAVRPQSALNWLSPIAYERLLSVYAAKVA